MKAPGKRLFIRKEKNRLRQGEQKPCFSRIFVFDPGCRVGVIHSFSDRRRICASEFPSAFERAGKRLAVGEFKIGADGNAIREPGDFYAERTYKL